MTYAYERGSGTHAPSAYANSNPNNHKTTAHPDSWLLETFLLLANSSRTHLLHTKLPDTILFRYRRPVAWFTYHEKALKRKAVDALSADDICSHFCATPRHAAQRDSKVGQHLRGLHEKRVVAYYVSVRADEPILYFDSSELYDWLHQRPDSDGILQRFDAHNECHKTVVRVEWTPFVCLIDVCINKHLLYDKRLPAAVRGATFDAPVHNVQQRAVRGPQISKAILTSLHEVLLHVQTQLVGHDITSCTLYLRPLPGNRLHLLYCSDIKASKPSVPRAVEGSSPGSTAAAVAALAAAQTPPEPDSSPSRAFAKLSPLEKPTPLSKSAFRYPAFVFDDSPARAGTGTVTLGERGSPNSPLSHSPSRSRLRRLGPQVAGRASPPRSRPKPRDVVADFLQQQSTVLETIESESERIQGEIEALKLRLTRPPPLAPIETTAVESATAPTVDDEEPLAAAASSRSETPAAELGSDSELTPATEVPDAAARGEQPAREDGAPGDGAPEAPPRGVHGLPREASDPPGEPSGPPSEPVAHAYHDV